MLTQPHLSVSPDDPLLFHRFTRLLERLAAEDAFPPSPTCMRTTVDVVKALRTLRSGFAKMMYTFGTNMQPRATVALRLTEKHMVTIL